MEKYGRLTVIGEDKHRKYYVICQCDCGRVKSIRKASLTKKTKPTVSCGCYHTEITSEVGKKSIAKNSTNMVERNVKYNTNVYVISDSKNPSNNTSGCKGVSWDKSSQKWISYISVHRKHIFLGKYKNYSDAVKARKAAEDEYFKPILEEIANDNSQ